MEPVYLRSLEVGDLEQTYKWHNDPALYESLVGTFRHVSRAADEEWLRKAQTYSTQDFNLAICLTHNSEHVGNIYLRDIDWVARRGEMHMFLGVPEQRSKGYGRASLRLLLKYAFEELGLERVYLFVLEDNEPAVKTYERCGFRVEGKLRRHAFKGGRHKDVLVMGICSGDELPAAP